MKPLIFKPAVEVETLYGTRLPIRKILKTIESRISCVDELWIVVLPPQAVLFYKHLRYIEREIKKKIKEKRIRVYTVDILRKKLVPLEKIIEYIIQQAA